MNPKKRMLIVGKMKGKKTVADRLRPRGHCGQEPVSKFLQRAAMSATRRPTIAAYMS